MKTIRTLYRLQTSSLATYQAKYGHYTGMHFYSVLHGKAKGNVINLCLHLSTADLKILFADQERKKNQKKIRIIRTVKN